MARNILRGGIFYADLNPVAGSEQGGVRPVLILQNDIGNMHSPTVIVAAVTTKRKANFPTHISLSGTEGLRPGSVVLLEQVRTIDKLRLDGYIGALDEALMEKVDQAIAMSLGLQRMNRPLVLSLCSACVAQFYDSPGHDIRRVDRDQQYKEPCTYCIVRSGYDYEIRQKNIKKNL